MSPAADDPRSVAELFAAALGVGDDELRWDAVAALHWRGSREILDRAAELCRSSNPEHRTLGADILGQLGIPERAFLEESFAAIMPLLADADPDVLASAIIALQHLDSLRAAAHVLPFRDHSDHNVRYAVAFALGGVDDDAAIATLAQLASDQDLEVRNWATFGLGRQCEADTPEIRDALSARLDDHDPEIRYEAICGLARRRDPRMIRFLKIILHDDPEDVFAREAAARLLGREYDGDTRTSELLGALQRQQRWAGRSV